ncbi:glycosyltransferase family 69 protein [Plenodomus tracheiphilus IPT5]|uniref:Glycosyltransferase family 69 protein n=1 Tax=Plenodomus tracheiphilus IPT5 TaxID=1408161 RepID=A0A6A7BMN3_9PLEO|nr:glycosyltransferase family 69 protein [Plenodomus tracheiphilus IPT5]
MDNKPSTTTTSFLSRRRRPSHTLRRLRRTPALRIFLLLLFLWDFLHCITLYLAQTAALNAPPPPANYKRIYIAAQHWNNARLLRQHWNDALVALVQELGSANVFVSIYESGSYDDTKGALRELDNALEGLGQPSEHGWVETADGQARLRRIPFLARIRNHVFEPLERMTREGEESFDSILFLNDVVFTPRDVLNLLDTNGGEYAAACSMDYQKPPYFYDTFALRDARGHEAIMQTWPFFRDGESRWAAERYLPVPVKSCWNGMVAMPIKPFISTPPLRFRAIPDSLASTHLEASECCLIHADNPFPSSHNPSNTPSHPHSPPSPSTNPYHQIFLNPIVKVAYNGSSYDAINAPSALLSPLHIFLALWQNRILRWGTTVVFKEWGVRRRVEAWLVGEKGQGSEERGSFCLVDEMQILYEWGWKHV